MKLLVFGATGGVGLEICRFAVSKGHSVTAFVRTPSKFAEAAAKRWSAEESARVVAATSLFQGDVMLPVSVASSFAAPGGPFDVVLISLGGVGIMARDYVCSQGTINILVS